MRAKAYRGADGGRVDGGQGNDILLGSRLADELDGGPGDDVLRGDSGGDTLDGGPGADVLEGEGGRDDIAAVEGTDRLVSGGSGGDSIAVSGRVAVTCGTGVDEVFPQHSTDRTRIAADCEQSWFGRLQPVAWTDRALTFWLQCSDWYSCRSELLVRHAGRLVGRTTFEGRRAKRQRVRVRLAHPLPPGPAELTFELRDYRSSKSEVYGPTHLITLRWRAEIARS